MHKSNVITYQDHYNIYWKYFEKEDNKPNLFLDVKKNNFISTRTLNPTQRQAHCHRQELIVQGNHYFLYMK